VAHRLFFVKQNRRVSQKNFLLICIYRYIKSEKVPTSGSEILTPIIFFQETGRNIIIPIAAAIYMVNKVEIFAEIMLLK